MGSEQFSQAVRGSSGDPIRMTEAAAIETDNYREFGAIAVGDGTTAYPHLVDPAETIEELVIFETGGKIEATITSSSGAVDTVELRGSNPALNFLEIDSIEFKDPGATGVATYGMWIGE